MNLPFAVKQERWQAQGVYEGLHSRCDQVRTLRPSTGEGIAGCQGQTHRVQERRAGVDPTIRHERRAEGTATVARPDLCSHSKSYQYWRSNVVCIRLCRCSVIHIFVCC